MYLITDDYGTRQTAWTWAQALEWLAACSPNAVIQNRFTGRVLASRVQGEYAHERLAWLRCGVI